MQGTVLNINWINEQFELLRIVGTEIHTKATDLKVKLKKTLENKLKSEQWELSEFLIIALAINSIDELCSMTPTVGSIYKNDWANGRSYVRSLATVDVRDIHERCLNYYEEKIYLLEQEGQEINKAAPPIAWLEFVEANKSIFYYQRYITTYELTKDNPPVGIEVKKKTGISKFVPDEMSKLIRYNAFSLSQQEEDTCNEFPYVYTLRELANRWKTNEQNVIMACSKSSYFWPYLNISEGMKLIERTLPITTTMINENLRSGNLQAGYKYGLKGFVRLAKKIDLPHKITLEYFYANKIIDPKIIRDEKSYTPFIWLEAPFCKYILGIYQFIEVTRPIEPTLFFLAEEIHDFEKTDDFKKLFASRLPNNVIENSIVSAVICDNNLRPSLEEIGIEDIHYEESNIKKATPDDLTKQVNSGEVTFIEKNQNKFFKNGNCFEIYFETQKIIIKESKGLHYLELLIKKNMQEIHVNELERIVNKQPLVEQNISPNEIESIHLNDIDCHLPDTIADERAIKEVKIAIAEVKEELELAKEEGDIERAEELEEAIEKYNQYLSGAIGKHYRPRKVPDKDEKARKRVFAAIRDALRSIKSNNEMLYKHLSQSIKTGEFCCYKPSVQVTWC